MKNKNYEPRVQTVTKLKSVLYLLQIYQFLIAC